MSAQWPQPTYSPKHLPFDETPHEKGNAFFDQVCGCIGHSAHWQQRFELPLMPSVLQHSITHAQQHPYGLLDACLG
jgi:hypothetical protein